MSDYEKNIDKIRKYFEEHKAERYPFENALLSKKDEYVKSLYFRMLCTLTRYTGEPSEMQVLYIRRLIAGSKAENEFQDYMRMALDLDTKDIDEFISALKDDKLRFYFCVDGAIVLSIDNTSDKNFELFAELVEMLGICRDEVVYLATISKAIISRDVVMFDGAKDLATENVKALSMYQYIRDFYIGKIVDTEQEVHFYSYEKENVLLDRNVFKNKKVTIENGILSLSNLITFEGCEEVFLKNCQFSAEKEYCFQFKGCKKVIVKDCVFESFSRHIFEIERTADFIIENSEVRNCTIRGSISSYRSGATGIVVYVEGDLKDTRITITNSVFKNCNSQVGNYDTTALGIISNCVCEVNKSKFYNIHHYTYNGNDYSKTNDSYQRLFISGSKNNDNEIVGCPTF